MFLTRLGFGSKMVVTGDVTQVDLPDGTTSGLRVGPAHPRRRRRRRTSAELTSCDVVRHRLVSAIVDAYDRSDATSRERRERWARPADASAGDRFATSRGTATP